MRRLREVTPVPVLAVLVLMAAPVAAQNIEAGPDTWATPGGGGTTIELNSADWQAICPNEGPEEAATQSYQISFKGVPSPGQGDGSVVVERLGDAVFDGSNPALVQVRMTHLAFESESTTSTPCGDLDFRVGLDGRQDEATMQIRREGSWGGYFFVDLPVDTVIEAIDPVTQDVVGSVSKGGILEEPTSGTSWSYEAPDHALDPDAPWHPGVTSTGQRQTITRHHQWPASHTYKPVIYCGGGVATASTGSLEWDEAEPDPCGEPVEREETDDSLAAHESDDDLSSTTSN